LSENVLNSRYAAIHDIIYKYYRGAMDNLYDDEDKAREAMLGVLNALSQFVSENANTMIIQFFMQGKSDELINLFKKGSQDQRNRVIEILQRVDITNANKYKDALK
jgi:DNA-directed RNA polymerase specialized sigma24 family protein